MFSLLAWLQRNAHIILFILFEIISFYLIIQHNQKQKEIFWHSASLISGSLSDRANSVNRYFYLKEENDKLMRENARLLQESMVKGSVEAELATYDSLTISLEVIPARIISQSIHSTRNHLTIDKGQQDGITAPMGIITEEGVVGILKSVSRRYASAISLLHLDARVSASIEGTSYFGTVSWRGRDYQKLRLDGIPSYAEVEVGQWVVTNGYSTLFPPGIRIGQITKISDSRRGGFFAIELQTANDFSNLNYVYVVKDNFAAERAHLDVE